MKQIAMALIVFAAAQVFSADDPNASALEAHKKRLLEIARDYSSWTRADSLPYTAPVDCRAPLSQTSQANFSAVKADQAHGQKLYFLFASELRSYQALTVERAKRFETGATGL